MANIELLKNGGTEVIPRTTTQAVCMDDGTSFDVAVQSFTEANDELASTKNALESTIGSVSEDIAAQLSQLNETKALLKTRLTEKGVDVTSEENFYNLADKVGEIQSGGKQFATVTKGANVRAYSVITNGFITKTDITDDKIEVEINSLIIAESTSSMYFLGYDGGLVSNASSFINNGDSYIIVQGDGSFYFSK